jgi:hypothetical protein
VVGLYLISLSHPPSFNIKSIPYGTHFSVNNNTDEPPAFLVGFKTITPLG